jgi:hypothetical protein
MRTPFKDAVSFILPSNVFLRTSQLLSWLQFWASEIQFQHPYFLEDHLILRFHNVLVVFHILQAIFTSPGMLYALFLSNIW